MKPTESTDLLIIGFGPAGMPTALHLLQANPNWANRMVIVDKPSIRVKNFAGAG